MARYIDGNMSYKEMEKAVAAMRKDVIIWAGDYPMIQDLKAKYFDPVFKSFRTDLGRKEADYPNGHHSKHMRLKSHYDELRGYYDDFKNRIDEEKKEEIEIKQEQVQAPSNTENVIEIKQERDVKMTDKKKKTEIKEGQLSLSIRGGKRAGAGRKAIGIKKAVSISLPPETWSDIEALISSGQYESNADFFRTAAFMLLGGSDYEKNKD